jgi:hypothetical protein
VALENSKELDFILRRYLVFCRDSADWTDMEGGEGREKNLGQLLTFLAFLSRFISTPELLTPGGHLAHN